MIVIVLAVLVLLFIALPDTEPKTKPKTSPPSISTPDINYSQPYNELSSLKAEVKRLEAELAKSRRREQQLQNYYEQRIIDLEYDLQRLTDEEQRRIDGSL